MRNKSFELELRAQSAAEMIGGNVMETENGFVVEATMGGLAKYNISRLHTNLNTHCAVVGITRPMHETDAEVYIVFTEKRTVEHTKSLLGTRIRAKLDEDMNDAIEWIVCPIDELLDNETPCWLSATEDVVYILDGWYTVENHHHKVKFVNPFDLAMGRLDEDELPF